MTNKIKLQNETELKLIHLLDNMPPEYRTNDWLSAKLNISERQTKRILKRLEVLGLIKTGKAPRTNKIHYHLIEEIRKKLCDVVEV